MASKAKKTTSKKKRALKPAVPRLRICIVMEGGVVQSIAADSAKIPVDFVICDYVDSDYYGDDEGVVPIPQDGGFTAAGMVGSIPVTRGSKKFMDFVFSQR